MYGGKGFVNQFLYDELLTVSPGAEPFLFENIPDAIEHFAKITGVKADKLPTPEQREEIKKEETTLLHGFLAGVLTHLDREIGTSGISFGGELERALHEHAGQPGIIEPGELWP